MLFSLLLTPAHAVDTDVVVHLDDVHARLRLAPIEHLSVEARVRRASLLDALASYVDAGQFPLNTSLSAGRPPPAAVPGGMAWEGGRSPVFVDGVGSHCAVGYLLAVDGRDDLVQAAVEADVTGYLSELAGPALGAWATHNGFTLHELAQIQPTYLWIHQARTEVEKVAKRVEQEKSCGSIWKDTTLITNYKETAHGQDGVERRLPESIRACLLSNPSQYSSLALIVTEATSGPRSMDFVPDAATCASVSKVFEARESKTTRYEMSAQRFLAQCPKPEKKS